MMSDPPMEMCLSCGDTVSVTSLREHKLHVTAGKFVRKSQIFCITNISCDKFVLNNFRINDPVPHYH